METNTKGARDLTLYELRLYNQTGWPMAAHLIQKGKLREARLTLELGSESRVENAMSLGDALGTWGRTIFYKLTYLLETESFLLLIHTSEVCKGHQLE